MEHLETLQPREDYKEFLQLCLVFIGLPPQNFSFKAPGAIHPARWMAKAIYCLKIYLFSDQLLLTQKEMKGTEEICVFIINIYAKAWFNTPKPALDPKQDLEMLKALVEYRKIDTEIADKALSKFVNHLWYLSSEKIAFSFFDHTLDDNIKKSMAMKLFSLGEPDSEIDGRDRKAILDFAHVEQILDKQLDFFVTSQTLNFFKRFSIETDFLNTDTRLWNKNPHYLHAKNIVNGLRVVNDTAERGVKLIQDFNSCLTKDEEQRQFLLQVVSECRKIYPDVDKASLSKPLM